MPQALASKDAIRVHMRRVWLSTVPLTTVHRAQCMYYL